MEALRTGQKRSISIRGRDTPKRYFFIDNLLVQIHLFIEMI